MPSGKLNPKEMAILSEYFQLEAETRIASLESRLLAIETQVSTIEAQSYATKTYVFEGSTLPVGSASLTLPVARAEGYSPYIVRRDTVTMASDALVEGVDYTLPNLTQIVFSPAFTADEQISVHITYIP